MNEVQKRTVAFDVVGTLIGPHYITMREMLFRFKDLGWTTVVWSSNAIRETESFCAANGISPDKILEKTNYFIPELAFDDDQAFLDMLEVQGCKGIKV